MKLLLSKPNEALRLLYEQSFPPEERRDWCALPVDNPAFKLWAIVDYEPVNNMTINKGDESVNSNANGIEEAGIKAKAEAEGKTVEVGLVTVWEFDGFSYVEHFAVQPGLRGAGVGSWVLSQLREPVILEVEPAGSTPEAERRIRFYERNGFRVLDVPYVQPPYSSELPELELKLMLRGDIEDIDAVIKTIHKNVYNKV